MTRVKRGTIASKTRRNVLKKVKGFRFGRSTKEIMAHEALVHAGKYSFAHRKDKKNDFRRLWTVRINAAIRPHGLSYSKFINILKLKNIEIDRKILANLAINNNHIFKKILEEANKPETSEEQRRKLIETAKLLLSEKLSRLDDYEENAYGPMLWNESELEKQKDIGIKIARSWQEQGSF